MPVHLPPSLTSNHVLNIAKFENFHFSAWDVRSCEAERAFFRSNYRGVYKHAAQCFAAVRHGRFFACTRTMQMSGNSGRRKEAPSVPILSTRCGGEGAAPCTCDLHLQAYAGAISTTVHTKGDVHQGGGGDTRFQNNHHEEPDRLFSGKAGHFLSLTACMRAREHRFEAEPGRIAVCRTAFCVIPARW